MARFSLLSSIFLLLLGVAWAAGDDPPLDPDQYEAAASRSEVVVARQLLDPQEEEGLKGQLQGRRRRLGARRRLLDPEKRRQLLLRRRKLGLPLRRRPRPRHLPTQEEESLFSTIATFTPSTTTTSTTTQAPLTSTSTSSSFSSSSVSSSSSSSTTLRSIFPSFSAATRLRAGTRRGHGWGEKTTTEDTPKREEDEEKREEEEHEGKSRLPELERDLEDIATPGDLKGRRRGVPKIVKRPLRRRLNPTLSPTLVISTPAPQREREDRFRFRSFPSGKRLRGERRKQAPQPHPFVSPSSSTTHTPIVTTTTTAATTTTTHAPTSSLPPPPTHSTVSSLLHRDQHPLLHNPDFWEDSPSAHHTDDSTTSYPESSTFGYDSLVLLPDSSSHASQPDSPAFDYDSIAIGLDTPIYIPDSPAVSPDSSVFGIDLFSPSSPTFLPSPSSSKPRHTPVPKKVSLVPQPKWPFNPKFRQDRRFKLETQQAKSIVPRPKYVSRESRPPQSPAPLTSSPTVRKTDHAVNGNSDATQRIRHFDPIPSYRTHQEAFQEEQSSFDPFSSRATEQISFEQVGDSHLDRLPSFVSQQDSLSHYEPEHLGSLPSFVDQVTPKSPTVTRERKFISEESNFPAANRKVKHDRGTLQSAFSPSPRDHFRDAPGTSTSSKEGFLHTPGRASLQPDLLLHDSEIVFAPHVDFEGSSDPLYHSEVIYTPDQGDSTYDETDDSGYEDEEARFEDDYEDKYEDEDVPGVLDHYKYGYQVDSEDTGNFQQRYEARDGATVSGSYKVALPDGRVQVVTYVADDGGFRAEVNYEGEEESPSANPAPASAPPSPRPTTELPPVALSSSRRSQSHRRPQFHSSQSHHSSHLHSPQPFNPGAPGHRIARKNLRFSEHVTTASPNPFRLVVEGSRASTHSPPSPLTSNALATTPSTPQNAQTTPPRTSFREYAPATTNAHTIAPPHSLPRGPSSTTTTTTAAPPPLPTSTPRYEYDSLHTHTTLYSPTTDATAYIHALGRSHAVPVLLPLPSTYPRTYFLHDREGDSVELQRGDASRPRISIRTPSPHQTDIYPSPRPPLFGFV